MLRISKLLACITFFYSAKRLGILQRTCESLTELSDELEIVIVTNDYNQTANIINLVKHLSANIKVVHPVLLGHPYLLTWCHLEIFRKSMLEDQNISHFLYLEDDIILTKENISYWLEGREILSRHGLIPSFLRYEISSITNQKFATDITKKVNPLLLPKFKTLKEKYCYASLPQPYQGMYLLDRVLLDEHLSSDSSNPDCGSWPIREKATQGITFLNVPRPFTSRNVIGYTTASYQIDSRSLIHHSTNNYVNDNKSQLCKIPIEDLFCVFCFYPSQVISFCKQRLAFLVKGKNRDRRAMRRLRRRKN